MKAESEAATAEPSAKQVEIEHVSSEPIAREEPGPASEPSSAEPSPSTEPIAEIESSPEVNC